MPVPLPTAAPCGARSTRISPNHPLRCVPATRWRSFRRSRAADAMARIKVQAADFDIGAEFAALTAGRTDIGGIGCFVGTVRSNAGDRVAVMTLEHYPAMTERAIARITTEAERRW